MYTYLDDIIIYLLWFYLNLKNRKTIFGQGFHVCLPASRGAGVWYDFITRNIACVFESNVLRFYQFFPVYFKMVYIIKMKFLAQIQLITI